MLVLTRRIGETLIIGNDAEITLSILSVRGNQVRMGINAPKNIPVHREEIYHRIKMAAAEHTVDIKNTEHLPLVR